MRIALVTWETNVVLLFMTARHTKIPPGTPSWGTNHVFETAQYLWLNLVIHLTRATYVNNVSKKAA